MTDAELIELSLRARLAQAYDESIRTSALANTVYVDYFRISSTLDAVVLITRSEEPFFRHRAADRSLKEPDAGPKARDISCNDEAWAMELLQLLRVAQVLDNLARVL